MVLKYSIIIVSLPIFLCSFIFFCLTYFGALFLSTYMLSIVMSSQIIDPFTFM